MNASDGKPWYASQGVWGGAAAVASGIGGAIYALQQKDMYAALASLTAAAGGFHAIVGRVKADSPIGRVVHQVDDALTAAASLAPTAQPQPQQQSPAAT